MFINVMLNDFFVGLVLLVKEVIVQVNLYLNDS